MAPRFVVILDSNAWVYGSGLLREAPGVALLRTIAQSGGLVGLPEVVEREVEHLAQRAVSEVWSTRHIRGLRNVLGASLPESAPEGLWAQRRFTQLEGQLLRLPFEDHHGREAFVRVVNKVAPNSPDDQQYKDTLLWLAVLDAAKERPVHFITSDGGFYSDKKKPEKGLAGALQQDVAVSSYPVDVFFKVADCLAALDKSKPAIDLDAFIPGVTDLIRGPFSEQVAERRGQYGAVVSVRGAAHDVNDPAKVAVDLFVTFEAEFETPAGARVNGTAVFRLTAEGTRDGTGTLGAPRLEEVKYYDANDTYLFGNLFLYIGDHARLSDAAIGGRFGWGYP